MIRGLYTSASGMLVSQERMDVATNNLANVNTPGFREQIYVSKSYPENEVVRTDDNVTQLPRGSIDQRPEVGDINTGVASDGTYTNFEEGKLKRTGNPLDLAITGEGFFTVEGEEGEDYYTRDGIFHMDEEGSLVTGNGRYVLGENGRITVSDTVEGISIGGDGTISNGDGEVVDRLQITQFENPQRLRNRGENFFVDGGEAQPITEGEVAADYEIRQGFQEISNTDPIRELINTIEIQRLYEMNSQMIQKQDEALGQSLQRVAGT